MLFSRRKRLESLSEREAGGESLWTSTFDEPARIKVLHAFRDQVNHRNAARKFYEVARARILRDEGWLFLCASHLDEVEDLLTFVTRAEDRDVPTVIEAMSITLNDQRLLQSLGIYDSKPGAPFDAMVNTVLREHRIAYELIDSEMIEIESLAMHGEVVAPVIRLLGSTSGFEGVEKAYRDALEELAGGKAGDAITDAGTALQELLTAMGCEGNALGPLIKSAKSKGLLAGHDVPLLDAMEKALHWVSADRSEKGDAHSSNQPTLDDAWLTVHMTGALILRLSKGPRS